MNLWKRLFHKHEWVNDFAEELPSEYHIVRHCKVCGKIQSEYIKIKTLY